MNFLKLRPDINSLQIFGFFSIIFWSVTGNSNLIAGFGLIFALVGYAVARSIREARANQEVFNPLTHLINSIFALFSKLHLGVIVVAIWILTSASEMRDVWLQSAFNMSIGVGNWQQIARPENYFSPDSLLSPFVHLWVVSVAVQFVIVLTLIGFAVSLVKFELPLVLKRVLVLALYLSAFYFMYSFHSAAVNTTEFFLSTWSWLWAVVLGVAIAYTDFRFPTSRANAIAADTVFIVIAAVLVLALFNVTLLGALYPFIFALLLALLVLFSMNETLNFRFLSANFVQKLADISLSVFLWSWPLIQFTKNFFGVELLNSLQLALVLALSLGFGTITQSASEFLTDKLNNLGGLRQGVTKLAALTIVPLLLFVLQTPVSNEVAPDPQESITFTPSLDQAASDVPDYISNPDCTKNSTKCIYGNPESDTRVLLYGSSLSGNWQPALAQIAIEEDWKLEVRINPDCPSFERTKKCDSWLQQTKEYVLTSKPDLVISNFGLIGSKRTPNPSGGAGPSGPSQEVMNYEIESWLKFLEAGVRVAVLRGPSIFQQDPIECLQTSSTNCVFDRSQGYITSMELKRYLGYVQSDLQVLDLTDEFCNGNVCPATTREGTVIYRDYTHITKTFSLTLVKMLQPLLVNALTTEINTRPKYCLPNDSRPECN